MTALVWDTSQASQYETGVSHGILFSEGNVGVPWNGLVNVTETAEASPETEVYFDGRKVGIHPGARESKLNLQAFSYPFEFNPCLGQHHVVPGFVVTGQLPESFGLSYRSMVGEDHYKIHLIYGANALKSRRTYSTRNQAARADVLSFDIFTNPPRMTGIRNTGIFVVDSRRAEPTMLFDLETFLYGDEDHDPQLPPQEFIAHILSNYITEPLTEPI